MKQADNASPSSFHQPGQKALGPSSRQPAFSIAFIEFNHKTLAFTVSQQDLAQVFEEDQELHSHWIKSIKGLFQLLGAAGTSICGKRAALQGRGCSSGRQPHKLLRGKCCDWGDASSRWQGVWEKLVPSGAFCWVAQVHMLHKLLCSYPGSYEEGT